MNVAILAVYVYCVMLVKNDLIRRHFEKILFKLNSIFILRNWFGWLFMLNESDLFTY